MSALFLGAGKGLITLFGIFGLFFGQKTQVAQQQIDWAEQEARENAQQGLRLAIEELRKEMPEEQLVPPAEEKEKK